MCKVANHVTIVYPMPKVGSIRHMRTLLSLFGATPRIPPGMRERAELLAVDRCGNHSHRRV